MDPAPRYATAAVVAALLTGGVALTPDGGWSLPLLAGIAVAAFAGTAFVLRHPDPFRARGEDPNWAAGAFAGAATFGTLMLLTGVEPSPHIGAGVLGLALAWTGFAAGIAHERE